MNDILKQRVVGGLILLALGVAFWPIIFVEPNAGYAVVDPPSVAAPPEIPGPAVSVQQEVEIDKVPESFGVGASQATEGQAVSTAPAENLNLSDATAEVEHNAADNVAAHRAPDARQTQSATPSKPAAESKGGPEEWTLQVATVSSAEKVEHLRRELGAMKQQVYVTTVQAGGKNLHRVCIGRTRSRAELERLQATINSRFGVTSMVVRYTP